MITLEQKNNNEIRFMELLQRLNIDLTEINKFLDEIKFFDAPASTQYYGSYPGGLCEYALKSAHELGMLCNAYFPGRYTEEDVIKVALFKDIYKATMYEAYQKNIKDEMTGQWVTVPAYRTRDGAARPVFGNIGFSSFMQISKLIKLSDEQIEAIVQARATESTPDIHEICKTFPLVTLTKMADLATTYFD